MSTAEKLLARMRAQPLDWQIGQLETVARYCGLKVRKPSGSHVIFQKDGCLVGWARGYRAHAKG